MLTWLMGGVVVRLLGCVEAGRDDTVVDPVPGSKLQALVGLLALAVPHPVSADRLIDELWGDEQPANPANALQAQISQLRRLLGREKVLRRDVGYVLVAEAVDIDATRLEQLVRDGRTAAEGGDHVLAAAHFGDALALLRGSPLAELADYRFARTAAGRLDDLVLAAHEGLVDAWLITGRHAKAITALTDLVDTNPLRERFHAQLILALYRAGRQADALRAYQGARDLLLDELGLEPGPELQALEQAVLVHDPSLAGPGSETAALPQAADLPGERHLDAWRRGVPGRAPAAGRLPFVGRAEELGAMQADVDDALAARGRLLTVSGEPGVGKTRLVEELAHHADQRGMVIVWSRCYEGRGAPAFWPWTQAVHGLLDQLDADVLRTALGADISQIAQIAPRVKELVEDLAPVAPTDPESARFQLFEAMAGFLGRLAAQGPVVLFVDDLHWADPSSMQLVAHLAATIHHDRLLVVATYRNVDPTLAPELAGALAEMARQGTFRGVDLDGLDEADLAELLTAAGTDPSRELLDTVRSRTRGNPFFVTEILRLLPTEHGVLDARDVGRVVPAGVRGVIRQRIARLPDVTVETLVAASVLGQDFDLALLGAIVDATGTDVLERLEPAVVSGILVDSPDGGGRYRFCHGLVTETIYADMGAAQRARMHLRAGEGLEARHGDADGPHLMALAAHWFHAVPAAWPDKGIKYAVRSASWAQDHVAHQQAADHLRAALELVDLLPDGLHRAGHELAIQDQLSGLLIVGQGYSAPGVSEACARMRELCLSIDDGGQLLPSLWRLTVYHCVRLELETALTLGQQLLDLTSPDGGSGHLLTGHMALGCANTQLGRFEVAQAHLDEAMSLLIAGHDRAVEGAVLETPGVWARAFSAWNIWMLGDEDRADALALEAVDAGRSVGPNSYGATFATWFSVLMATLSQRAEVVRERSEAAIPDAVAAGYGMFVPMLGAAHGWATASLGDTDAGALEMDEMTRLMDGAGVKMLRHFWFGLRADVDLMAGNADHALGVIADGLADVEATDERWYEAELHRLRGRAFSVSDGTGDSAAAYATAVAIATDQHAAGLRQRAEAMSTV